MRVVARHDPGEGREGRSRRAEVHAARARAVRGPRATAGLRAARRRGWSRAARRTSRACAWIRRRPGRSSGRRARFNRMPSENMVWADRQGTIGWQAAGIQPLRRNWSGMLPVPGDGRYEWDGYLPITALPHAGQPRARLRRHGEQLSVPERLRYPEALHYTWADPFRASRIAEVLGSGRLLQRRRDDAAAERRPVARRARARAAAARRAARRTRAARRHATRAARGISCSTRIRSPAGIYAMWQRRLLANTREVVGAARRSRGVAGGKPRQHQARHRLAARARRPLRRATRSQGRDALRRAEPRRSRRRADQTLRRRHAGVEVRPGEATITRCIRHPLSDAVNARRGRSSNVGPFPRGGDGIDGQRHRRRRQPDVRRLVQDRSRTPRTGTTPSASTRPASRAIPTDPHYRDLFDLWARGRYFPLAYSRNKVLSVTERTTTLEPARTSTQQQ